MKTEVETEKNGGRKRKVTRRKDEVKSRRRTKRWKFCDAQKKKKGTNVDKTYKSDR